MPFCDALTGTSFVPFNTIQPSTNLGDRDYLVLNWLSVFNQHPTESKSFTVRRYDQTGNLLSTEDFDVAPRQRRDIDGGHGEGATIVGLTCSLWFSLTRGLGQFFLGLSALTCCWSKLNYLGSDIQWSWGAKLGRVGKCH